ncbi:unnamed protein product [Blepharisma stoltei]|uniref:Tetratricopeptide repeat protein n=1 Tax=Blepharisma stoltei TaxID=1481888 RepID=A0AAU9JGJ6_9CILI|nr:unnamed protein product [Blepharisma stoltei]
MILEIIKIMKPCFDNKAYFYEIIGSIYLELSDFRNSTKNFWKSIKICNKTKSSMFMLYFNLFQAYYLLKRDMKTALKMITNAKSCLGLLLLSHTYYKTAYFALINVYYNMHLYEDALECYERIKNYCTSFELRNIKFIVGDIYLWKENYDKALEIFTEIKEHLLTLPEANNSLLFVVSAFIGELLYRKGNMEGAFNSFSNCFRIIYSYKHSEVNDNLLPFYKVFQFFLKISDYEKCEIIVSQAIKLLENKVHRKDDLALFLILKAKILIFKKLIQEAELCLINAEEILNLEKIISCQHRNLDPNRINQSLIWTGITEVYINLNKDEYYLKAEKTLKYLEASYSVSHLDDWSNIANMYALFGILYCRQEKWNESKKFLEKVLDISRKHRGCYDNDEFIKKLYMSIDDAS